jgi:glycosyltransferase involved in cell wall biosynthesis
MANPGTLPSDESSDDDGTDSMPRCHRRGITRVLKGDFQRAEALIGRAARLVHSPRQQAIVANDLAVLAARNSDIERAIKGFTQALELDPECRAARLNLDRLDADRSGTIAPPAQDAPSLETGEKLPASAPRRTASGGATRVAILSFLFNWPSTGGGIVHTVELADFLGRAGYDVRHIYARSGLLGVGRHDAPTACPGVAIDIDGILDDAAAIKTAFRRAVDDFAPDRVIITDSWNSKPLLAEAVRGYPYFLRLQAMECLCPLNNVRLLPADEGGFRQCPNHQLANPSECHACLGRWGPYSGGLHRAERELCGVGSREYHESLVRAFREAEAVLVVNPLAEAMIGPHANRVRTVTAGMDPARFPWPWPDEAEEGGSRPLRILFAGLVDEPIKGFAVLQEACRRLRERRRDFELVATADPAGSHNEFTSYIGWQSQDDLPRRIRECDILAMPTVAQEALGRTAVEAMAAGRPVVASRLGGLPFTVIDGATGLLVEPGDPGDLARKLEILLDDPALRRRLGDEGRRRFDEHYAWPVIIERHYRPLLDVPPPGKTAIPASQGDYRPQLADATDTGRLIAQVGAFFNLEHRDVERRYRTYSEFHRAKDYARLLGERKTLCFEEAFILYVALGEVRPRTILEIGTQHGRSTRRILDMRDLLGLESRVVCLDIESAAQFFGPEEAELIVGDSTGHFEEILREFDPGLIYMDCHAHALLAEVVESIATRPEGRVLAIHDCTRGLCNPRMTIARDDPAITSSTGVWERHVLAEAFGIDDPFDPGLDGAEAGSARLRIFDTPHGLALLGRRDGPMTPVGADAGTIVP